MTTIPFKDPTPVLRLQNLNVTFAGSPVSVLDGISLTVSAGAVSYTHLRAHET